MKMIQLRTLALLLAAGLSGSAWAAAPEAEQSRPATVSTPDLTQAASVQPEQKDPQPPVIYAWDRVGKPIGKESFFI